LKQQQKTLLSVYTAGGCLHSGPLRT